MKILKLLNKKYLSILIISLSLCLNIKAEEQPIDIWNIDKDKTAETYPENNSKKKKNPTQQKTQPNIYNTQSQNQIDIIQVDSNLNSKEIEIIGLYDPNDYSLEIDMWSNSNGDQLKNLFSNIENLDLSEDALNLMNIFI